MAKFINLFLIEMDSISNILRKVVSHFQGRSSRLITESDVFCMAPWIQLHAQTNGKVAPCCMSSVRFGNEIGDLRINPNIEELWNSANMKQLRLNMLSGKKSSICSNCYAHEEIGKTSERKTYNRDFVGFFDRVKKTKPDGTVTDKRVPVIDIRFSNKCNYKCRICSSEYSSSWHEDELRLGITPFPKDMKPTDEEETFWKSFKRMLPGVERLHFAGGEPLFMDEHYDVLEYLISIGKTDVNLTYNTNFSTLRYKRYNIIEQWQKFKKVDVWASLDDLGNRGDYHRKGQQWEKIESNIREVQQNCKNVLFGVNVTVSIFNVLSVPSFFQYMVENNFVQPERFNLYPLYGPHSFCITNLLPELKQQVKKEYSDFENNYLKNFSDNTPIKNHLKAIVTLMDSNNGKLQKDFKRKVMAVDELRNESFTHTFPELREMLE